jgi:hypothetical protein
MQLLIQLDTHQDNFFTKPTTWSSSLTPPPAIFTKKYQYILKFVSKLIYLLGNFELSRTETDLFILKKS